MPSSTGKFELSEQSKVESRETWGNQCDFFLSCLGYAVGLGNVWRFPYLCYLHGGGSFLVAYSLMLLLAGLPLFFLELALGQYGGMSPLKVFGRMAPMFKGLGHGMLFITFLVALYYNMIIAWTIFYTFAGLPFGADGQLPWSSCGSDFNTQDCYKKEMADDCNQAGDGSITYWNNSCTTVQDVCQHFNMTLVAGKLDRFNFTMCNNGTHDLPLEKVYRRISASEDYYYRVLLGLELDTSFSNFGHISWQLVLSLFAAWLIVGLCLIKGVQSSGKVVYFTALFPYFVLTILLVLGVTLPGAADGVLFYLTPKFNNLWGIAIWGDAATQIFYSLGPGFGGLITLASYNRFDNNCHRDAILIALANCSTSVFAGFVIFSIIGNMAYELGQEVGEVIASGPGLAFIAYPEAVTRLPLPHLFSFLFFFMLITLGLDSQFTMTENLITALLAQYPSLKENKPKVVLACCLLGFALGLIMCFPGGILVFTLLDSFSASWSLLLVGLAEIILVNYLYGQERFFNNISEMGMRIWRPLKKYWSLNWFFTTPIILSSITIITWVNSKPASFTAYKEYVFPLPAQIAGWAMAASSIVIVTVAGLVEYRRRLRNDLPASSKDMISPTDKWGQGRKQEQTANGAYSNEAYSNGAYHGSVNDLHM